MEKEFRKYRCICVRIFQLMIIILMSACSDAAKQTTNPDIGSLNPPTFTTESGEKTSEVLDISMTENTQVSTDVQMFAQDEDGNSINWKVSSSPTKGTVVINPDNSPGTAKTISYKPRVDAKGEDSFEIEIDDGTGFIDKMTINVTIVAIDLFISVDVSGYSTGNTFVLQLNGVNDIPVSDNGTFIFSKVLNSGDSYNVTATAAAAKFKTSCVFGNAKGTMSSSSKTNVALVCTDDIAPNVINKTPTAGELDIATDTAINAVFDEDMLGTSIGADALILKDSLGIVSGAFNYNENNRQLSFVPSTPLAVLRPHTVNLSPDITDISGQSLVIDPWTFTTLDAEWGSAKNIVNVTSKTIFLDPQVALNSAGQAISTWVQDDGSVTSQHHLYSSHYNLESKTWSPAKRIDDDHQGYRQILGIGSPPKIALDSIGRGLAVWQQLDGLSNTVTVSSIRSKRFDPVLNDWENKKSILIESNDQGGSRSPQLAMNSDGRAIAVWLRFDGTVLSVSANYYDPENNKWGVSEYIESNPGRAFNPHVAINSKGEGLAVWSQIDTAGVINIWANYFNSVTNGWNGAKLIGRKDQGDAGWAKVAISSSGLGIAIWPQDNISGDQSSIWANYFDAGTLTWGNNNQAVLVETANTGNAIEPQIVMDSFSQGVAVWRQFDESKVYSIFANYFDPIKKEWGVARPIELNSGDANTPQIALDPAGQGIVVWTQRENFQSKQFVWATRFDSANKNWGDVEAIGETDSIYSPSVALDKMGHGFAIWKDSFNVIKENRFE